MLPAEVERHRFTVEEYHRMGEAGIFSEDDRVELVEGEIVRMTPIGRRHVVTVNALTDTLADRRGSSEATGGFAVSVQNPLILGEHGELQPDLALLRRDRSWRSPTAEDTLLVIEVADSSLSYDQEMKLPLYAAAGIPEAWIVNLRADRIEVYSEPKASTGGYGKIKVFGGGEEIAAATLDGVRFNVDEVLPSL